MKKSYILAVIVQIIFMAVYYYFVLPPINVHSMEFWSFVMISLAVFAGLCAFCYYGSEVMYISSKKTRKNLTKAPLFIMVPVIGTLVIVVGITVLNFFYSPLFNAKSYSQRITVDQTAVFTDDFKEVDFDALPLLDRVSSEKLGDRVMGQMSELVSQYYVSDQYTQINYNDKIVRVTPLEYADFIKWFTNRKEGVKGFITVNSVDGNSELTKMDKGMKYMPSAYFNENLYRQLRFQYPTETFGEVTFEIDNEGKPFWIATTYDYTAVGLKARVSGVVILDPVTGESKKYDIKDVPTWVDNAYCAELLIEQVDNWGMYKGGYWNSIFGQKNVVNTTDGYNYLAMNDDIYLYTGITSVLADESNLGFVLSNMRTGETKMYSVAGAEEYSAMSSAEGQVQQMGYISTFPLLINLNNKPTYLVSLKDAAGLVKMYGFVDVADYQKVVVSDASKGIEAAAQNYLNSYAEEINSDIINKKEITIKKITSATKKGNTYYYVTDELNKKYVLSIELGDELAFVSAGDKLHIGYYDSNDEIIEVIKLIKE